MTPGSTTAAQLMTRWNSETSKTAMLTSAAEQFDDDGDERATGRAKALAHRSAAAPARSATRYSAAPELEPEPEVEPEPEPEVEVAPLVAGADEVAEPAATVAEPNAEAVPSGWADPSGWAPVPVPPPTYTLKARAERPVHIPEFVELTEYAPVLPLSPDDLIDEGELDGLPERRSAAGA